MKDKPKPADAWGAELQRVMTKQGVTVAALAAALGIHQKGVCAYRMGHRMPRVDRAAEIAEVLTAPHLLSLCIRLRSAKCGECGTSFVRDQLGGRTEKRWCSDACGNRYTKRVVYANARRWNGNRYDTWKRKWERARDSIEAMCRACEPEGACRLSSCELRAVSPLPLIEKRASA